MAANDMDAAPSEEMVKGMQRITSKFTWDKKVVLWEIQNVSETVGRRSLLGDEYSNSPNDDHAIQEFQSLLDIDYINSTQFDAGSHPKNNSVWSLSLHKQTNPEYLGMFLHLHEIQSATANRRLRLTQPFDRLDGNTICMKYVMSIVSATGTVLNQIDNLSIVKIQGRNSWGEDKFLRLDALYDPKSHFLTNDTLRIQVDLYVLRQLSHLVHDREGPDFWEKCQAQVSLPIGSNPLMESLWTKRSICSDVTIECGERLFPVHKCILSVASPVFAAMFLSDMVEASQSKVIITDTNPAALEIMLEFVYTGKLSENWYWGDFDELTHLLNVSEKYQVKPLKNYCLKMVCDRIDVSNAGEIGVIVHLYNAEEFVKNFVYKFIIANMKTLRQHPEFVELLTLNPAAFVSILLSKAFSESV